MSTQAQVRDRSRWSRLAGAAFLILFGGLTAAGPSRVAADGVRALPSPSVHPRSTEICLNSRVSHHGGWSTTTNEQALADVLYATGRAPVTGAYRTIYAATAQNVYLYDPAAHALIVHLAGDHRSDATAAFQVGVAAEAVIDAGAAVTLSQLEGTATWTGTAGQFASCPRASDATYANSHWNPPEPIDMVVTFGLRSVPGLTTTLVAISTDGSLPNPHTDGTVLMDDVLADLAYDSTFAATELSLEQVSQLLWAAYGCSNHFASGGKAALVCPSAVANYYLTKRIYRVGPGGVDRYHNRRPPGVDLTTRDHRLERITTGDVRPAVRAAVAALPPAPEYLVLCIGTAGAWAEMEVGFAALGAVLEASTIGLQGWITGALSAGEQSALRTATGIPSGDLPIALVSLGEPGGGMEAPEEAAGPGGPGLSIETVVQPGGSVAIRYVLPADGPVSLIICDAQGRQVRALLSDREGSGPHGITWDGRDDRGESVPSGVYFCRLRAGGQEKAGRAVIVR